MPYHRTYRPRPKRATKRAYVKTQYSPYKRKAASKMVRKYMRSKLKGRPNRRVYARRTARVSHYGNALVGGWNRGGALPPGSRAKLQWYRGVGLTLTSAIQSFRLWDIRVDSLFEPEDLVSHQPRGFDEWMAQYQQYKVNRVKIVVTTTFAALSNMEAELLNLAMAIVYQIRGTSLPVVAALNLENEMEGKRNRVRRFELSHTEATVIRDTFYIDPHALLKSFAGRQDSKANSGWAAKTASPSYETGGRPHFGVDVHSINTAFPDSVEVKREIMLSFECSFKRPVVLAESVA